MNRYYAIVYSNSLSHHGIKGQKWGVRRYQNEDGSLTSAGRSRYGSTEEQTLANKKNEDGSRKYSKETQAKLKKGKAPMNAAEKVLNVASLGNYQRIKNAEMRYRGLSEKDQRNVTGLGLAIGTGARAFSSKSVRSEVRIAKTLAAYGSMAAYELSGRNPAVKTGAMIFGKALNTAGNIAIASIDAYNLYGTARDTKNYIENKRNKGK